MTSDELQLLERYNSVDWIVGDGADAHLLMDLHARGYLDHLARRKPRPSLYKTSDKGREALRAAGIDAAPSQWGG